MDIPKLTHEELIAPERKHNRFPYQELLCPNEIPIYPQIPKEEFAYSQEFLEEVFALVPDMVAEDVETIEHKLNLKLPIRLTSEGIFIGGVGDILYKNIILKYHPGYTGYSVDGRTGSAWIDSDTPPHIPYYSSQNHPLPIEKARIYAVLDRDDELDFQVWRQHNIDWLIQKLFSRSFAIAFNNLGIKKLESK